MKSFVLTAIGCALCLLFSHQGTTTAVTAFSPAPPAPPAASRPRSTTALFGVRSAVRKVFRRGVRTLEKEEKKKESEEETKPEEMYRLVYHDSCDYQPEGVARVLAKLLPMLDRRTAYELCSHARMAGKAPLLVTDRNNAERYALLLRQYGLTATVEPHGRAVPKR